MKREDRKSYRPAVRRDLLMLAAAFCRLSGELQRNGGVDEPVAV